MHTPGPWKWTFIPTAGVEWLRGSDGTFADKPEDRTLQEAAPELLEALRKVLSAWDSGDYYNDTIADIAKAAIAKAAGHNPG